MVIWLKGGLVWWSGIEKKNPEATTIDLRTFYKGLHVFEFIGLATIKDFNQKHILRKAVRH